LSGPIAESHGAHARLNQLVAAARNEYVAVLNSDDLFADGRFCEIERELDRTQADLLFGDLIRIDAMDRFLSIKRGPFTISRPFPRATDVKAVVDGGNAAQLLVYQNFAGTSSNFVFSKTCFNRVGGFRAYRYVHDWDFLLRVFLTGTVRYVRSYLTCYRIHAANTISENSNAVDEEISLMSANLLQDYYAELTSRGAAKVFESYIRVPYSRSPRGFGRLVAKMLGG
jgi:hypothetical protein